MSGERKGCGPAAADARLGASSRPGAAGCWCSASRRCLRADTAGQKQACCRSETHTTHEASLTPTVSGASRHPHPVLCLPRGEGPVLGWEEASARGGGQKAGGKEAPPAPHPPFSLAPGVNSLQKPGRDDAGPWARRSLRVSAPKPSSAGRGGAATRGPRAAALRAQPTCEPEERMQDQHLHPPQSGRRGPQGRLGVLTQSSSTAGREGRGRQ